MQFEIFLIRSCMCGDTTPGGCSSRVWTWSLGTRFGVNPLVLGRGLDLMIAEVFSSQTCSVILCFIERK